MRMMSSSTSHRHAGKLLGLASPDNCSAAVWATAPSPQAKSALAALAVPRRCALAVPRRCTPGRRVPLLPLLFPADAPQGGAESRTESEMGPAVVPTATFSPPVVPGPSRPDARILAVHFLTPHAFICLSGESMHSSVCPVSLRIHLSVPRVHVLLTHKWVFRVSTFGAVAPGVVLLGHRRVACPNHLSPLLLEPADSLGASVHALDAPWTLVCDRNAFLDRYASSPHLLKPRQARPTCRSHGPYPCKLAPLAEATALTLPSSLPVALAPHPSIALALWR